MSGYGGRGGSYARRGSSSKKVKHRKQEFHEHRIHLTESEPPADLQTLKDRTVQSLERLGKQTFVPGSDYGLEGWMKSLRLLLEDFEANLPAPAPITESYRARKADILDSLSRSASSPDLDAQIAQAREAEAKVIQALGNRDASYFGSQLADLKRRQEKVASELEDQRATISRVKGQANARRLWQRFLGESPPSTAEYEAEAARLQKELEELESQIVSVQGEELLYREGKRQLASASEALAALEAKKSERLQLVQERDAATRALAEEVSKISPS